MLNSSSPRYIFNSGADIEATPGGIFIFTERGKIYVTGKKREQGRVYSVEDLDVSADVWSHLAVTWKNGGRMVVYMNNKFEAPYMGTFSTSEEPLNSTTYIGRATLLPYHTEYGIDTCLTKI